MVPPACGELGAFKPEGYNQYIQDSVWWTQTNPSELQHFHPMLDWWLLTMCMCVCMHRPTFDEVVFSLQGILLEQRQGSSEGLPPYPPNGAAAGRVEGSCAHDGDQRRHQQFQPLSGSEASFTYADNSAIIASPIDDSMC